MVKIIELLENFFSIKSRGSTVGREIAGGTTTFMTLAYIIVVQPVVLSKAGMDFGSVLGATCLSSAFACFIMGFYANYPVALAPAMGQNFYFAYVVVLSMGISWQTTLASTLTAGIIFFLLTLSGLREKIMDSLPKSLLNAMAAGIGFMIALVGFEWAGIITPHPGTIVGLGKLNSPPVLLSLAGIVITSILLVKKVSGAILLGIIATAITGMAAGIIKLDGVFSTPPSINPTFLKFDFSAFISWDFITVTLVFLFLDIFDTIGTLAAIAPAAGLMKDGHLTGGRKALIADASGTVTGALLGTSTITCYVESAAGIESGARTGMAAVVAGLLFLTALFFLPVIKIIGGGIAVSDNIYLYPVTSPALIVVGVMMMDAVKEINWDVYEESIPAFLTIAIMTFSINITEGIAFGLISYSFLSLISGKAGKVAWPVHICAVLMTARYLFLVN